MKNNSRGSKGQALVEYVLLVALLLAVMVYANGLVNRALCGYFNKIAAVRSGVAGMGP